MADAVSAVRVVITGGAGFLGSLLARRLLTSPLTLQGGQVAQVGELLLVDLVAPPADLAADGRVRPVVGEVGAVLGELGEVDAVFHLAGVVSGAAEASDASWGSLTAMNLPALTTTPREMAASLDRVAGAGTSDRIDWSEDPGIGAIVRSWPAEFRTPRAGALGLRAEDSFDEIVRAYLADNPGAGS